MKSYKEIVWEAIDKAVDYLEDDEPLTSVRIAEIAEKFLKKQDVRNFSASSRSSLSTVGKRMKTLGYTSRKLAGKPTEYFIVKESE